MRVDRCAQKERHCSSTQMRTVAELTLRIQWQCWLRERRRCKGRLLLLMVLLVDLRLERHVYVLQSIDLHAACLQLCAVRRDVHRLVRRLHSELLQLHRDVVQLHEQRIELRRRYGSWVRWRRCRCDRIECRLSSRGAPDDGGDGAGRLHLAELLQDDVGRARHIILEAGELHLALDIMTRVDDFRRCRWHDGCAAHTSCLVERLL